MQLSGYMNALTEHTLLTLQHGMEYLMHHQHETIMYSRKKIHNTEDIPHQCYFKSGDAKTSKNK